MPIHDWTRVEDGVFHAFHIFWLGHLQEALNCGRLPEGYYALADQIAGQVGPDVLTLQTPNPQGQGEAVLPGAVTLAARPPQVHRTARAAKPNYARKRRTLLIRHRSGHRIVAMIEIVSPGNKASRNEFDAFIRKASGALTQGIHLLILDLFPPSRRDPAGIHSAIWEDLTGETEPAADKPLTLVAYVAGPEVMAYIEPVAVGDALPDMPLFLDAEQYIEVPLEETYRAAYRGVPAFYREVLEGPHA
jgi:hypothetical protein